MLMTNTTYTTTAKENRVMAMAPTGLTLPTPSPSPIFLLVAFYANEKKGEATFTYLEKKEFDSYRPLARAFLPPPP